MPAIKISLNRLINLFGESVNNLPEGPVRALAAQLMTLTAHVIRVDQKSDAQAKELGAQISTLTEIIQTLAQRLAPASAVAAAAAPGTASTATPSAENAEQQEEPTVDDEYEARLRAETEAEVAAANGASGAVQ